LPIEKRNAAFTAQEPKNRLGGSEPATNSAKGKKGSALLKEKGEKKPTTLRNREQS